MKKALLLLTSAYFLSACSSGSSPASSAALPAALPAPLPSAAAAASPSATMRPSPNPASAPAAPIPTPSVASGTPDFGPNVLIFDPSMSSASVQSRLDAVYARQQTNQFGTDRYALLFKPGAYTVNVNVGFYTQVLGLGQMPDDVSINGAVQADASWDQGNATQNFWRSAENLAVTPRSGTSIWAVSQASPLRRVHVKGNLMLFNVAPNGAGGWASGGFLADCVVDGQVAAGSQQQWFARNTLWKSWSNAVWNMVFTGDPNAPATTFPTPPYTTLPQTPLIQEKPFLTVDAAGNYGVLVPPLRGNSQGPSWSQGATQGQLIPIAQFYIAHPSPQTGNFLSLIASKEDSSG